ncbi:hypothetical protein NDU88_001758 [Pleurodeles waltl]|uniref:Uncharacterized protein n=1 Tax=Pleurodeles waltl TaxID=8319 RepID=A0AAV7S8J2_PLEWA|nr:hypothetical protein NDU88_001758 [Pleurodeles waltl]
MEVNSMTTYSKESVKIAAVQDGFVNGSDLAAVDGVAVNSVSVDSGVAIDGVVIDSAAVEDVDVNRVDDDSVDIDGAGLDIPDVADFFSDVHDSNEEERKISIGGSVLEAFADCFFIWSIVHGKEGLELILMGVIVIEEYGDDDIIKGDAGEGDSVAGNMAAS